MIETIEWFTNVNRPSLSDGHILAKISGVVYSGVYVRDHFVPDQIDFMKRHWREVELWCYFPKGENHE